MRRKLNIPVAYVEYRLKEVARLKDEKGEALAGQCDFDARVLEINRGLEKGPKLVAFLHEWLHAAFGQLGYDKDAYNEEKIEALAQALARLLHHEKSLDYVLDLIDRPDIDRV